MFLISLLIDCRTPLWRHFWNPVTTLRYPAVWWAALIVGVLLGLVVIQLTLNSIYFPALYHFSGLAVGNLNISVRIPTFRD